eukprot:COSAG02_NODE_50805_length_318_cov_0.712329_1_plen_60_part_01
MMRQTLPHSCVKAQTTNNFTAAHLQQPPLQLLPGNVATRVSPLEAPSCQFDPTGTADGSH